MPLRFPVGDHGTRARYVQGCRCAECKRANVVAYHERQARSRQAAEALGPRTATHCVGVHGKPCAGAGGPRKLRKDSIGDVCAECRKGLVWNGLVASAAARQHLVELSKQGVGRRAVAAATDISRTILHQIRTGQRMQIRATTEARILAVDGAAASDAAIVDARPTWRRIRRLRKVHGFTLAEISRRVGQAGVRLQLGRRRVTVRNAHRIERLLADAEGDFLDE